MTQHLQRTDNRHRIDHNAPSLIPPDRYPPGATFFVTFRLADSIPRSSLEALRKRCNPDGKQSPIRFSAYDDLLNRTKSGPRHLRRSDVARIVRSAIRFRDQAQYDLVCYCIMPNHVHLVFGVYSEGPSASRIMQSLKSYTARAANELLDREGPFWEARNYGRWVQSPDELAKIIRYVLLDPVRGGLVDETTPWPWSYCRDEVMNLLLP